MTFEGSALILAWLAIALLALAMSGLVRQVRALSTQPRGGRLQQSPLVGSAAPELPGQGWTRPTVLLFVAADCDVCKARLADLEALAAANGEAVACAAVFAGEPNGFASSRVKVLGHQRSAFDRFRVPITPFGVVVTARGIVSYVAPVGSSRVVDELGQKAKEAA
jgi:hypothetical protein